jgi:hypothetical protein
VLTVLKSGSLKLLEPYGPVQACNGIALSSLTRKPQDYMLQPVPILNLHCYYACYTPLCISQLVCSNTVHYKQTALHYMLQPVPILNLHCYYACYTPLCISQLVCSNTVHYKQTVLHTFANPCILGMHINNSAITK